MSIGYPDWQRVENWDSPVLVNVQNQNFPLGFHSTVFDVSRYAALQGVVADCTVPIEVSIGWYADPQAAVPTGGRHWNRYADAAIQGFSQFNLMNLGPWVALTVQQLAGNVTNGLSLGVIATNRQHALDLIPTSGTLYEVMTQALPAATTQSIFIQQGYAGPVQIGFFHTTPGVFLVLNYLADTGVNQQFAVETPATGWTLWDVVFPTHGVRLDVVNPSGTTADTYHLSVVASMTGGS